MSKDTRGKIIFAIGVVLIFVFLKTGHSSPIAPTLADCQTEVATATVQLINAVSAEEKNVSLDAKPGEVEHDGKSSTVYLIPTSMGGGDTITAGGDVWVSQVHRTVGKKKDTFVLETTTQTNHAGQCRVLSMTIVDHISGR